MKNYVLILSLYVMSLNFVPAAMLLHEKIAAMKCSESCSDPVSDKPDGCEKQCCSNFSCCFKTLFFNAQSKEAALFVPISTVKNNYFLKNNFLAFRFFDIWHPPKNV